MGEFAAIDAIRRSLRRPPSDAEVWIGDDAAVLPATGTELLLLSVDAVVAGVHADLRRTGLADFGWKAMVASLSDMAAMGARPTYALVSISGPDGTDLQELYRGIGDAADTFDSPVVGGDLTNASELVVSVTVAGTCSGSPVRRDGARAGDEVWVTGPLGASAAGLRLLREGGDRSDPLATAHARPWPRIGEGQAARLAGATAMCDVSDGLAADVSHLAEASAVGIELTSVPIAAGASLDDALGGGEDFELVFCAPAGAHIGESFGGIRRPIRVGTCTDATVGIRLNGEELPPTGWQHRW